MRRILLLALVAGGCAGAETPPAAAPAAEPLAGTLPGDRVPSFRATVRRRDGGAVREEPLDSHAARGTTLYIVNSTRCPYCIGYADRMREIEDAALPRGVDVVHVYPNRGEPAAEKVAWHAERGFRGGQVLDGDASIARLLQADRTPAVYLVDARGVIVYRGAIDDAPEGGFVKEAYLADALDAHFAGRPVLVPMTEPYG